MESDNVADIPIEPIVNEENPTPSPDVETVLPEISTPTGGKSSEHEFDLVLTKKEVEVSVVEADLPPLADDGQQMNEGTGIPEDAFEISATDLDKRLTVIINKEAEHKESLTIENLEIIEKQKKEMRKQAKLLARQERQEQKQKEKLEKSFKKHTRTIRIGNFDTEMPSQSDEDSSSSSSEDDRSEISIVSFKEEFFAKLGSVPALSNIYLDRKEKSRGASISHADQEEIDPDLKGRFVNSLTGETESETLSTEEIEEDSIVVEQMDVESSSSDLDLFLDSDIDEVPQYKDKPQDIGFFFDDTEDLAEGRAGFIFESDSFILNRELKKQMVTNIKQFLHKLFDTVVTKVEMKIEEEKFPERLDKIKLYTKLNAIVNDYLVEQNSNIFLNSKAVDCYRRMRRRWAFAELSLNEELSEYRRYKHALNHLDSLKEKAAIAKKKASNVTATVLLDMAAINEICISSSERIEQRIRDILVRKDSDLIIKAIEIDFRRMRHLQNEISEARMTLINQKHTLAKLIERSLSFEKITDELTTSDFLSVQRDVMNLSKRLNEREERLQLIHYRCNKELKRSVYYHERRTFDMNNLAMKKKALVDLRIKREDLRKKLCQLKVEHIRFLNQKNELSYKAGLLYKPALMIDYDKTVELVAEKRKKVLDLRNTVDNLEKRINVVESRPRSISSSKPIGKLWAI